MLDQSSGRMGGHLRITVEAGFVPVAPIADLLASFSSAFPGIKFSIKLHKGKRIHESLISGSTNLVFCRQGTASDFARQYNWTPASLHLLASDRTFNTIRDATPLGLIQQPLVDLGKDFPVLSTFFSGMPEILEHLSNKTPERTCSDRNIVEHLIRSGMVGTLPLSAHESLPTRLRALDHIVTPVRIGLTLSMRKKESRELIESLFLEHFLEYSEHLAAAV